MSNSRRVDFFKFGRQLIRERSAASEPVAVLLHFDASFGDQLAAIELMFPLVTRALRDRDHALERFDSASHGSSERLCNFDKYQSNDALANHLAGSLFVLLKSQIFETAVRLRYRNQADLQFGTRVGRTSLMQLIRAASNNFRHYEEWSRRLSNQAHRDIRILQRAGVRGPFDRNVCAECIPTNRLALSR
jgi:hypothetical protein